MADERITIDDPDDEVLPASRPRRRFATVLGCLTLILLIGGLVWFIAANSRTLENPGFFGG